MLTLDRKIADALHLPLAGIEDDTLWIHNVAGCYPFSPTTDSAQLVNLMIAHRIGLSPMSNAWMSTGGSTFNDVDENPLIAGCRQLLKKLNGDFRV